VNYQEVLDLFTFLRKIKYIEEIAIRIFNVLVHNSSCDLKYVWYILYK
jgi:hypothetical protein